MSILLKFLFVALVIGAVAYFVKKDKAKVAAVESTVGADVKVAESDVKKL